MNNRQHLLNTVLAGITVITLGLTTGGHAAQAKALESTVESQSDTQLVALKFKKLKKHHGHRRFKKVKKFHHSPKKVKKVKKLHHGHHKFIGHQKFHQDHFFR